MRTSALLQEEQQTSSKLSQEVANMPYDVAEVGSNIASPAFTPVKAEASVLADDQLSAMRQGEQQTHSKLAQQVANLPDDVGGAYLIVGSAAEE